MAGEVLFVTHPEVVADPATPVPQWGLSETGVRRMTAFAASPETDGLTAIWSSEETKAVKAATILAEARSLPVRTHAGLGENDRSATGFLPPPEFEAMADAFFGRPEESVRGWERAVDAQARIAAAFAEVLEQVPDGRIALVAHGGVGTLLKCRLAGLPISRSEDQPFQGCFWRWNIAAGRMVHGWRPIAPR
jgi:broad specificity phosphatase PhoE